MPPLSDLKIIVCKTIGIDVTAIKKKTSHLLFQYFLFSVPPGLPPQAVVLPAVGITIRVCGGDEVPGQDNQVTGQSCEMRKKIFSKQMDIMLNKATIMLTN